MHQLEEPIFGLARFRHGCAHRCGIERLRAQAVADGLLGEPHLRFRSRQLDCLRVKFGEQDLASFAGSAAAM